MSDGVRQCWDVSHADDCDCGADPDAAYEAAAERRAEW